MIAVDMKENGKGATRIIEIVVRVITDIGSEHLPVWLDLLFSRIAVQEQVLMFGKEARRNDESNNFRKLVEIIAKGGETMVRQREDFVTMLVKIDKEENENEKEEGLERVLLIVKNSLETSSQLNAWMESVDTKYPIKTGKMWTNILKSFSSNVALALGLFFTDFGTDTQFTRSMRTLATRSVENGTEENCTEAFREQLDEIESSCRELSAGFNPTPCSRALEAASVGLKGCFNKEEERYEEGEWNMIFLISLAHMILPWVMCGLGGLLVAWNTKQWRKMLVLMPVVSKIRLFIFDRQINQLRSKETSKANEEEINKLKEEKSVYEGKVTVALLLEANSESSFQFAFQTLFSLPTVILSITSYVTAQHSTSIDATIFTVRNFSILISFTTMAYSFFSIRYGVNGYFLRERKKHIYISLFVSIQGNHYKVCFMNLVFRRAY